MGAVWHLCLMPIDALLLREVGLSRPVLLFVVVATLLTGLAFGLVPAWRVRSVDLAQALRSSGRGTMRQGVRLRRGLVAAQVAIAYASKAGSTAEVADFIGRRLAGRGLAVDVRRAGNVRSLDGYRTVLVGSAIRAGHWLSEASGFVESNRSALASRQAAFFTLCMTLSQDTPQKREQVAAYLKPVRAALEPQRMAFFAGKMEYRKLALGPRLIAKAMKVPEGDFRNWDAIGAWADQLAQELLARA
jgi:menaquinone-dependent protoporphyrinogen oxidase